MLNRLFYIVLFLSVIRMPSAQADGAIRLSLEKAVQMALSDNTAIRLSSARVRNQQFSVDFAESEFDVKIRPSAKTSFNSDNNTFGAGIRLDKHFETGISAAVSQQFEKQDHGYSGQAAVSLHIPLLRNFGKETNLNSLKQAQFGYRTAERNLYITRVNIMLETITAVYDIIKTKNVVQVYESLIDRLRQHAVLANNREKVGLATPIDIYRAEIHQKDAENNLNLSREYLQNAEDRLKLILSLPLHRRVDVHAPSDIDPVRIDLEEAVEIALTNRIELEQTKDDIRESRRKSAVAGQNIYPDLELVLGYDRYAESEAFGDSFRYNEDRYRLGVSGSTDFMRTGEKLSYQRSRTDIETSELNLSVRQNEIIREVRRQFESIQKAESRIRIREQQIRQARGKMALSEIKFNHGMADNFDIIEAETEFQKASVDLLSVKTDYIVGAYRLRAAVGTLIER